MKITIIYGQNHKGSTYYTANMLAKKLGGKIVEFFLPRDFSSSCTGCTMCFMDNETRCPHYENLNPITKAIDDADIIIFASPVYVYHVTGPMKTLLDHYGYRWVLHRPQEKMFGKQAVCISTAAGGGTRSTNKDMADSFYNWGISEIYRLGINVMATSASRLTEAKKEKIDKATTRLAKKIMRNYGRKKTSLKVKANFYLARFLHTKNWAEKDVEFWHEKGWDKNNRPWK